MEDADHDDNADDTEEGEGCLPGLLDLPPEPLCLLLPPLGLLHHPGEQLGRGEARRKEGELSSNLEFGRYTIFLRLKAYKQIQILKKLNKLKIQGGVDMLAVSECMSGTVCVTR